MPIGAEKIFFPLEFTFNIILHQFQVYRIMVRQSYAECSTPIISSTQLAPYTVITILLTVIPKLHFTFSRLFYNYQFVLLNPFSFFTQPPNPHPFGNHQSVLCVCKSLFYLFVIQSETIWYLSFSDLFPQHIPCRSIHAVTNILFIFMAK